MGKLFVKLHYIGTIDGPFRYEGQKRIMHLHIFLGHAVSRIHIGMMVENDMTIPDEDLDIYSTGKRIGRWIKGNVIRGRVVDFYETT